MVGTTLVFMEQPNVKPKEGSNDHDKLIVVPFESIEDLGRKTQKSSAVAIKCPFKSGSC